MPCQSLRMNSVHSTAPTTASTASASAARWAGAASILQGLILFVPMIVLGGAINWPESLSDPADIALPRLLENEGAVRFGYIVYLVYSILFAVTMILLLRYAQSRAVIALGALIAGFAAVSALARSIGIVRWLVPAPDLAEAYVATANETERVAISVVFDSMNAYGGTIGEVLGVSIFAALSIGLLAIAALRTRAFPRWIGAFGLIAALGVLATTVELAGEDASSLMFFGTTLVQLWFLAVGIWLLVRGSRQPRPAAGESVS
jgi:Domain of unknown function (DUF4386)